MLYSLGIYLNKWSSSFIKIQQENKKTNTPETTKVNILGLFLWDIRHVIRVWTIRDTKS